MSNPKLNILKLSSLFAIAVVASFFAVNFSAAQERLKVGDCVEGSGKKGKIIGLLDGGYNVRIDGESAGDARVMGARSVKKISCSQTTVKPADEKPSNERDDARNENAAPDKTNGAAACPVSDSDSDGKTANEESLRGAIRRLWEKEAAQGSDGAVTITFQKFVGGAPRAWRANLSDAYSQADPKKPIYPVRATFTTCTDYRKAISTRKMERIYDCFTHKTGGVQCTQTGASGALAKEDKGEYIQKP